MRLAYPVHLEEAITFPLVADYDPEPVREEALVWEEDEEEDDGHPKIDRDQPLREPRPGDEEGGSHGDGGDCGEEVERIGDPLQDEQEEVRDVGANKPDSCEGGES